MATAKKKAAPKKKAVVEKKTGEKYASKAMMAKHEKGESKKMRMMEGEIKKFQKGGIKERIQSTTKKGDKWIYVADKSGTVSSIVIPKKGTSSALSIDTTGYSKGKPNYKLETVTKGGGSTTNVKRKDVKKLLTDLKAETKSMQGYKKGGKVSCSCGGKGCMKCGGKKYQDGGKKTVKGLTKGIEYDKQGKVIMKYDVASKKGDRNVYQAYPDGQLVKSTYNPTKQNARRAMLDTTGYSKGKQSFPKTIELENTKNNRRNGKVTTIKTKVPRKLVKTQIKSMQTMKKGGKMC